jgi:replicative DNA helicase
MNTVTEKIPFNLEAENYIIGCLFIDPNLVGEVITRIGPNDFYTKENKNIMTAIINLYQRGDEVEYVKVLEELKSLNLLEASGGKEYLYDIIESLPSTANVDAYVEVLEEKSLLRQLYYATGKISRDILEGKDSFSIVGERAQKDLNEIIERRRTGDIKKIHRFTSQVLDIIEANKTKVGAVIGLDTGFDEINKYTFGFQKGELVILAARPSIGKSALALNIASNACRNVGANVAFFSLEMGIDQLTMRLFSSFSGLSINKIRSGNLNATEMATLLAAKASVDKLNLYLDEAADTSLNDIEAKCIKLKREQKLDLIVVDYLQLIHVAGFKGNRVEEVGVISRGLKLMARELEVPVLALSQLSRSAEQEGYPLLSHLRESGSIEQDADIVMFLHREQQGKETDVGEMNQKRLVNHNTKLIIAKNRQGATGIIDLIFKGAQSTFSQK